VKSVDSHTTLAATSKKGLEASDSITVIDFFKNSIFLLKKLEFQETKN